MYVIVGTVPIKEFPFVFGQIALQDDVISIGERKVSVNRGTPALLAAALKTAEFLDLPAPYGCLAGDIGRGEGSKLLYEYIAESVAENDFRVMTFHYLQPNIRWYLRAMSAIEKMQTRPVLIADAGSMYVAKMSRRAHFYNLFTPDIGELAFLADEEAPHPFYTRGFILHEENRAPELVKRAYVHGNAAQVLLVKGQRDYIADEKGIYAVVDGPVESSMEAIGGTGDTITGIVTALISSGMPLREAAFVAAQANRVAGSYAKPTPATQVMEIITWIPKALEDVLRQKKEESNSWVGREKARD